MAPYLQKVKNVFSGSGCGSVWRAIGGLNPVIGKFYLLSTVFRNCI